MKRALKNTWIVLPLITLAGCGGAAQQSQFTPTQPTVFAPPAATMTQSSAVDITEVAETKSYRDAMAQGLGDIEWLSPAQAQAQDDPAVASKVRDLISKEGARLGAVDYAALAIDPFKDVTKQLTLSVSDFQGGEMWLDAVGRQDGANRWLLYGYTGPQMPRRPDRPLVYRWVQTYALYDMDADKVLRLIATIRGEVHE